jgi:hypothetical protein
MPLASLFSSFAARLFGGAAPGGEAVDPELVKMGVESVVDAVDPRLRAHSRYSAKLAPAIACTIVHLRRLAELMPEPFALSRSAWTDDPRVNAFFATPGEVPEALGASDELRAFFGAAANAAAGEAHALLGMAKSEREVFAPALVDGTLRQDVAQTTVSFSHHRLICAAPDAAACRREVGVRMLRRLAALALQRLTALEALATELEQRKALLGARLRLLRLREKGLEEIAGTPSDCAAEITSLEAELQATADEHLDARASLATLQTRIDQINAVFGAPAEHIDLARVELRVNRLGYKVAASSGEPASNLTLSELSIGDGLRAVIAIVRCARSELPSPESLAARAARVLP